MKVKINQLTPHPFNRFFGDLPKEEFLSLKEDIRKRGIQTIVDITEDNVIICGHQRVRVLKELGIDEVEVRVLKGWTDDRIKEHLIKDNILRRQLNDSQIADAGEELEKIYEGREYQERGEGGKFIDRGGQVSTPVGKTRDLVAKDFGISGRTYDRIKKAKEIIREKKDEDLSKKWKEGKVKAVRIIRDFKIEEREVEIKNTPPLPNGKFNIIYADPPWKYEHSISKSRAIESHYPTMVLDDICDMNIPTDDNAVLFLWVPSPKLEEGLKVMKAWGFDYRTSMVWVKDRIGMGYYVRGKHEFLLIGRVGDGKIPLPENRPASTIIAKRREHSKKPEVVYEIIEKMYPNGKYLELFARQSREKWESWGSKK